MKVSAIQNFISNRQKLNQINKNISFKGHIIDGEHGQYMSTSGTMHDIGAAPQEYLGNEKDYMEIIGLNRECEKGKPPNDLYRYYFNVAFRIYVADYGEVVDPLTLPENVQYIAQYKPLDVVPFSTLEDAMQNIQDFDKIDYTRHIMYYQAEAKNQPDYAKQAKVYERLQALRDKMLYIANMDSAIEDLEDDVEQYKKTIEEYKPQVQAADEKIAQAREVLMQAQTMREKAECGADFEFAKFMKKYLDDSINNHLLSQYENAVENLPKAEKEIEDRRQSREFLKPDECAQEVFSEMKEIYEQNFPSAM